MKWTIHTALGLVIVSVISSWASADAQRIATANLNVRVFFGSQMGGSLSSPCSDIKIVATPKNGKPIIQTATGPKSGAKGGQCTASLKNLPAGVPIELKAVYSDFPSEPDNSYPLPAGKWTNPITLKAGTTDVKYIKIDGKP